MHVGLTNAWLTNEAMPSSTVGDSNRLRALMGDELARFEAGWPVAQEAISVRRSEALSALLVGLPRNLDELGAAWPRGGGEARCVVPPPRKAEDVVETLPASDWTAIIARRERGACIQLGKCESAFPELAAFVADLKAELRLGEETLSDAAIFMARAGRGFPRHRDSKDVWIIGLAGRKTVRTAPGASVGPDHRLSIDESPLPMPAGSTTHTLGRGDVLYIPRGCWHETQAETTDTFSISIGLTRPWRAEVMVGELLEVLSRDARWRRPIESREETIPAELIHELAGWLAQRVWSSGAADAGGGEVYLRNRSAALSLVEGKLQVETCGELTNLTVSSKLDLGAFVDFVQSSETLSAEAVRERFPKLESRACEALLKLLFQGGLLRKGA